MTAFRCIAMDTETAVRFRRTGIDDHGNAIRRVTTQQPGSSSPCRHCLRPGRPGEVMLLASFNLPGPKGIYWTPSPVFIHEAECPRFDAIDTIAPIIAGNSLVSVRAYDAADLCLYDLGHVCQGADVAAPLNRALDDPRTAFVNVHTARPGCWLSRVERL